MIINKDCVEAMALMPSSSVDLVCTDPPYLYGFCGESWDKEGAVDFKAVWKEALRVLKPGAFAFVMCAPRQDVLCKQIQALTDAGFDMEFSSIYHTYSSGFPKSMNISKKIQKDISALLGEQGVKDIVWE